MRERLLELYSDIIGFKIIRIEFVENSKGSERVVIR